MAASLKSPSASLKSPSSGGKAAVAAGAAVAAAAGAAAAAGSALEHPRLLWNHTPPASRPLSNQSRCRASQGCRPPGGRLAFRNSYWCRASWLARKTPPGGSRHQQMLAMMSPSGGRGDAGRRPRLPYGYLAPTLRLPYGYLAAPAVGHALGLVGVEARRRSDPQLKGGGVAAAAAPLAPGVARDALVLDGREALRVELRLPRGLVLAGQARGREIEIEKLYGDSRQRGGPGRTRPVSRWRTTWPGQWFSLRRRWPWH